MITAAELSDLGTLAIALAREGGELAARRRGGAVTVEYTKSSQSDIVTAVDREVEDLLRSRLASARTDDAILGEEQDNQAGTSGLTWVIDPIDGTVNYLYGLPFWSVSVAVCAGTPDPSGWDLLAGAVCAPALERTWHAVKGAGAYRDGEPVHVAAGETLAQSLVATGFGYQSGQRAFQSQVFLEVIPQVRDIRRFGSAAVDLCLVAEGVFDGYYESGINSWDVAAGELIVREAGGVVSGLDGGPWSTEMVIAANPRLAADLERLVSAAHTNAKGRV
ncbi:MAG TPA: inositol monophosphatase family protein [Actinomycetaceae bacterium]|nr:inositol monophosphatase family protein [Actinomycetaceae bacterium]